MNDIPHVYTALLDIIGYRDLLEKDKNTGTLSFKDALQRSLQVLNDLNEAEYGYQAISDTIIITCSIRDKLLDFLKVLKSVQIAFLRERVFLRGGLTYLSHFKSSNITYSHALAKAYFLENSTAIYPRIIIDRNILFMIEDSVIIEQLTDSKIVCKHNGMFFLNIIDEDNWSEIYDYAKSIFIQNQEPLEKQENKENEFLKHCWFEHYLFSSSFVDSSASRYIPEIQFI